MKRRCLFVRAFPVRAFPPLVLLLLMPICAVAQIGINKEPPLSLIPHRKSYYVARVPMLLKTLKLDGVVNNADLNSISDSGEDSFRLENPKSHFKLIIDHFTSQIYLSRYEPGVDDEERYGHHRKRVVLQPSQQSRILMSLISRGINLQGVRSNAFTESANFIHVSFVREGDIKWVDAAGIELRKRFNLNKTTLDLKEMTLDVPISNPLPTGTLSLQQAMDVCNWLILGNDAPASSLMTTNNFDEKQRKQFYFLDSDSFYGAPYIQMRRDEWLLVEPEWRLNFGYLEVTLNALTGRPSSEISQSDAKVAKSPQSVFAINKPAYHPKPQWFSEDNTRISDVMFNGRPVLPYALHHTPIVQGNTSLIFSDYFSSFLINVARDGQKITLQGQLPDKGKQAELTLGSTSAVIDGKPVTLSGTPQEIEGRLYLPYELLTLCNGVLTRWEPKKNTLWVDTRYLRRPD